MPATSPSRRTAMCRPPRPSKSSVVWSSTSTGHTGGWGVLTTRLPLPLGLLSGRIFVPLRHRYSGNPSEVAGPRKKRATGSP